MLKNLKFIKQKRNLKPRSSGQPDTQHGSPEPHLRASGQWKIHHLLFQHSSSQVALVVKNPPANAQDVRDPDSIPGWGRSPGGGNGQSIPVSLPGGGAWRTIVHGVTKSRIWLKRLSMHTHYFKKLGSISFWCGAATKIAHATKNIFYDPLRSTNIWVPSSGLNCPLHITSFKALASKGPSNWGLCIRRQTWPWMQSPLSLNTLPGNMWAVAPGTLVWLVSCFG